MKAALVAFVCVVAAVVALVLVHPWRGSAESSAPADGVAVETSALRPGQIVLAVHNGTREPVRIAQVIVNDAFVDFDARASSIRPGRTAQVTVHYAWSKGEGYEIRVVASDGEIFDDEIERAGLG